MRFEIEREADGRWTIDDRTWGMERGPWRLELASLNGAVVLFIIFTDNIIHLSTVYTSHGSTYI